MLRKCAFGVGVGEKESKKVQYREHKKNTAPNISSAVFEEEKNNEKLISARLLRLQLLISLSFCLLHLLKLLL